MHPRLSALLVAVGAVAALNSCDDPTSTGDRIPNIEGTRTVYALNGAPSNLPVALSVRGVSAVRIGANFDFDLALDINPQGQVVVYSARTVASRLPGVTTPRVGMLLSNDPFDQVLEAPTSGYRYDTSFVLPFAQTMLIDVFEAQCSVQSFLGVNIRAKMVLDSVNHDQRAIYVHMLSNPNCGLKSLVKGEPQD